MKIDEPKTPFVTDEEYKQACRDDPEYVREFGDDLDMRSDEADQDGEDRQCMDNSNDDIQYGKTIIEGVQNLNLSDEEGLTVKDIKDHSSTAKKPQRGTSFNAANKGVNGALFQVDDLANILKDVNDEQDKAVQKKKDFDEKRKKHYAGEFNMA